MSLQVAWGSTCSHRCGCREYTIYYSKRLLQLHQERQKELEKNNSWAQTVCPCLCREKDKRALQDDLQQATGLDVSDQNVRNTLDEGGTMTQHPLESRLTCAYSSVPTDARLASAKNNIMGWFATGTQAHHRGEWHLWKVLCYIGHHQTWPWWVRWSGWHPSDSQVSPEWSCRTRPGPHAALSNDKETNATDWPSWSLDLNSTENLWDHMYIYIHTNRSSRMPGRTPAKRIKKCLDNVRMSIFQF